MVGTSTAVPRPQYLAIQAVGLSMMWWTARGIYSPGEVHHIIDKDSTHHFSILDYIDEQKSRLDMLITGDAYYWGCRELGILSWPGGV